MCGYLHMSPGALGGLRSPQGLEREADMDGCRWLLRAKLASLFLNAAPSLPSPACPLSNVLSWALALTIPMQSLF